MVFRDTIMLSILLALLKVFNFRPPDLNHTGT